MSEPTKEQIEKARVFMRRETAACLEPQDLGEQAKIHEADMAFAGRIAIFLAAETAPLHEKAKADQEWMEAASAAVRGLEAGSFTGHPVVDCIAGAKAKIASLDKQLAEEKGRAERWHAAAKELMAAPSAPVDLAAGYPIASAQAWRAAYNKAEAEVARLKAELAQSDRLLDGREELRLKAEGEVERLTKERDFEREQRDLRHAAWLEERASVKALREALEAAIAAQRYQAEASPAVYEGGTLAEPEIDAIDMCAACGDGDWPCVNPACWVSRGLALLAPPNPSAEKLNSRAEVNEHELLALFRPVGRVYRVLRCKVCQSEDTFGISLADNGQWNLECGNCYETAAILTEVLAKLR